MQGDYEQAAQVLEEGLLTARQGGYKRGEALILISLGDLYTELEDFEIAEQNYRQAKELVPGTWRAILYYLSGSG